MGNLMVTPIENGRLYTVLKRRGKGKLVPVEAVLVDPTNKQLRKDTVAALLVKHGVPAGNGGIN